MGRGWGPAQRYAYDYLSAYHVTNRACWAVVRDIAAARESGIPPAEAASTVCGSWPTPSRPACESIRRAVRRLGDEDHVEITYATGLLCARALTPTQRLARRSIPQSDRPYRRGRLLGPNQVEQPVGGHEANPGGSVDVGSRVQHGPKLDAMAQTPTDV